MRKILVSLMVIAMAVALISGGTLAWFTDPVDSNTNTFTSGTLSINDDLVQQTTGFSITNMAPGDETGDFVVTIKNNGSLPLAWFGDWVFSDPDSKLMDAIYIKNAKMEFLDPGNVAGVWEPTDVFIANGKGADAGDGWYNTLAASNDFGFVSLAAWDDNNGMGSTPYENLGALMPGYSYRLTMQFAMAEDAGNEYQGLGPLTVTLKVDSTQMKAGAINALHAGYGNSLLGWLTEQTDKQHP